MGPDDRWDQTVEGVNTLSACLSQAVSLTMTFRLESTSCPKRVGFLCPAYLEVVGHDGEKENRGKMSIKVQKADLWEIIM